MSSTAPTQAPQQAIQPVENCGICLEPTVDDRLETACRHIFHRACQGRWLATAGSNGRCPICRTQLGPRVPGQLFQDLPFAGPLANDNNQNVAQQAQIVQHFAPSAIRMGTNWFGEETIIEASHNRRPVTFEM